MQTKTFTIQSSSEELKPLRENLRTFLQKAGFSGQPLETILIAIGEACTNCIRHSYHGEPGYEIQVHAEEQKDRIVLKVRDFGEKINLAGVKPPTLPPQKGGGLGVYFMQTMMDEMRYNTGLSKGNELILVKYKNGGEKPHEDSNTKK